MVATLRLLRCLSSVSGALSGRWLVFLEFYGCERPGPAESVLVREAGHDVGVEAAALAPWERWVLLAVEADRVQAGGCDHGLSAAGQACCHEQVHEIEVFFEVLRGGGFRWIVDEAAHAGGDVAFG